MTSANCAPPPGLIPYTIVPSCCRSGTVSFVPGDDASQLATSAEGAVKEIRNSRVNMLPSAWTETSTAVSGIGLNRAHSQVVDTAEDRFNGLLTAKRSHPVPTARMPPATSAATSMRTIFLRFIFLPNSNNRPLTHQGRLLFLAMASSVRCNQCEHTKHRKTPSRRFRTRHGFAASSPLYHL